MRFTARIPIILGSMLLGLSLGTAPAGAHDDRWGHANGLYLDIGGGLEYVNLPELSAYTAGIGSPIGISDDRFWRWSAEGAIGFVDGDGLSLPDPIGRNARIEGRLRYSDGKSDANDTTTNAQVIAPDLSFGAATGLLPPFEVLANSELESWDADLTYQTDVIFSGMVSLSPFLGITYSWLNLENDFKFTVPGTTVETNDYTRTHYYGGIIGTDLIIRPIDALAFTLGLRADLMGASSSMKVDQDFGAIHRDESDNDTNFAARGTASLGVELRWQRITLGVEAFGRYLSYLPVADHPQLSGGVERASNIDGEDMWSAGATGTLTIWFQ